MASTNLKEPCWMVKVLKAGFYTSIQDLGRFGYRDKGVPVSGAMDEPSLKKGNLLLENNVNAAVLEITMTGPTLPFESPSYVCISGAAMSPTLNGNPVENYKVIKVDSDDVLSFGKLQHGFRSYLAIKGGFQSDLVLGSRSQYFPVTALKHIRERDEIPYQETHDYVPAISELKPEDHFSENKIKVFKGPEFDLLTDAQLSAIFSKSFSISKKNDRMAYQLEELVAGHSHTMLTSGTLPGTVQLTPSGRIIILMKDGQTTGGYPRILQLAKESIGVLAQKKSRDDISFELIK